MAFINAYFTLKYYHILLFCVNKQSYYHYILYKGLCLLKLLSNFGDELTVYSSI